ncbi:hypothetical protein [Yersinia massiliensis]|uniref:hypothetical protein n=1 Tax=Yersinia massiliensis TaxID=419257 RepID=UPI0028D4CF1E|nr:hypothetical protein [Yersinia massiliensis]
MTNDKNHHIDAPTFFVSQQPTELTLSALLTQRCVEFSNSPKAVEIIDKGIEKLFGNLIDDAFGSYSDFGKVMKNAMKAALPTNVENIIELERYNSLVTRLMREKWETAGIESDIVKKMDEMITEFTSEGVTPKFIKASDLWSAFVEDNSEKANEERWDCPQSIIDDDRDGFIYVGLHAEAAGGYKTEVSKAHNCDVYLGFRAERVDGWRSAQILHEEYPVYELFSGTLEHNKILGKRIIKAYSRFDKLVLALYLGGSLLVWDSAPEDLYYPGND